MAVSRNHWRCLRGCTTLASAVTLTTMAAVLAAGSPPAQAALSSRHPTVATPDVIAQNNYLERANAAPGVAAQTALSNHHPNAAIPDAVAQNSWLEGVSALSPTEAWAAGYTLKNSGVDVPLLLRCSGTACKQVTSPAPPSGAQGSYLDGVSADSASDVWAAGYYENSSGAYEPLILHGKGTAWKTVTSPTVSGTLDMYLTVSADSATDAWAAGYYENSSGAYEPLTLHCIGTACKQVKITAPSGAASTWLYGVSAVSPTNAWAAGCTSTTTSGCSSPLIEHWNGHKWTKVTSPDPGPGILRGVSADSATDAWAAGYYVNSSGTYVPLTLHCHGATCKQVKSPAPTGSPFTVLLGVGAVSPADAWAAGSSANASGTYQALTLHCSGTACKRVKSPALSGAQDPVLWGVSADSATDAWAAGDCESTASGLYRTLILHCSGTACKQVTSANGT